MQFVDGAIGAGDLFAALSNSSGSTLQVLATDGAGRIIGQLLRHADGSDLYSFETTGNPASQQPVDSDDASASEAVGHDVSQMEATIAAGIAHSSVHVIGHDPVIDPGHDASITLAGVTLLTVDHLLFT